MRILILSTVAGIALFSSAMASAINTDVTSKGGVTIGGAIGGAGGKFVPWGGSVVLKDSDAVLQSAGHCAFNVNYDMENLGNGTTAPFKNYLLAKGATVAINSGLTLDGGQTKKISTQAYLSVGTYDFQLKLDAENNLSESNENNNLVGIRVTLNGACGAKPETAPPPKADLLSQKGIAIGGKSLPWGGSIVLHAADAILASNGQCAFNVVYDLANIGAAATGATFVNQILNGSLVVSQQSGLTLAKGATTLVHTQAYLTPGSNTLRLLVDAKHEIDESNENNNETKVTVLVDATCKAATTRK
ncbi:hypothetical protein AAKU55_001131 [Oxalobacteraceae bacterium GrIS 1.11]